MKKQFIPAIILCALTLLGGCTITKRPPEPTPTVAPTSTQEPTAAPETPVPTPVPSRLSVTVFKESSTVNNEENIVLLKTTNESAVVKCNNVDVSTAIQEDLSKLDESFQLALGEIRTLAQDAYADAVGYGTESMWESYSLIRYIEPVRVDESTVSLVVTSSQFTGGAHPLSALYANNYDSSTGARLTLRDVCTGGDSSLEDYINQRLPVIAARHPNAAGFFDGWKDTLSTLVLDDIWYFDEEGITIICNQYLIAPYGLGVQYFTVPYAELTSLLKSQYMPPVRPEGQEATVLASLREPAGIKYTNTIVIDEGGQVFYLTPTDTVYDVRLSSIVMDSEGIDIVDSSVVYAVNQVSAEDSIVVHAYFSDTVPYQMLSYTTGGVEKQYYLNQSGKDGSILLIERKAQ